MVKIEVYIEDIGLTMYKKNFKNTKAKYKF